MKNTVTAHPEAMLHCVCDVQAPLEAEGHRTKVMVMSTMCLASLLNEAKDRDKDDPCVYVASTDDILKYGNMATMWGALIYTDRDRKSYEIEAYGGDCAELQWEHPEIWTKCKDIIAL